MVRNLVNTFRTGVLVLAGALMACSPMAAAGSAGGAGAGVQLAGSQGTGAGESPSVHSVSGLPVIPLTVTTAKGRHSFRVELARTAQQQARGLMFRTQMGANEGMLFLRTPPDHASFWMRNTVIPLDIIYVGTDRRILNIAANAVPYDETPLASAGIAAAVLELNGGRAAELGLAPGDTVDW